MMVIEISVMSADQQSAAKATATLSNSLLAGG
jgi:hypothetical protein